MSNPGKHKLLRILEYLLITNVLKTDHQSRLMAVGLVRQIIRRYWSETTAKAIGGKNAS